MNKECSPLFVFLSSRVLLCSQDMFYVTSRQVACVCVCVRACKLVSFGMSIGLVHELWERHQSDWARSWQVTPGTNIGQLTNRGNSTTSIPSAPCTVHSYWCICQVHQSWEQYDKYSLRSLYTAQLLVYLSSTPVVGTVRQVFPWLLVQFTVPGVFVKYTSRGNSTTSITLVPCTVHSFWCICQVHQSWEQYDKYSLGSLYSSQFLVYLSSTQSWEQYDKYYLGSLYRAQLLVYLSSTPVAS